MNDQQLNQRLRSASEAIEMSNSAQARHLEAISAALADGAGGGTVIGMPGARASRRRRLVASVVAAAVIAPAGLAAASEGSVPGDALYPVKQLSERVLVLFDSDVIARHRIEEIERLDAIGRFDPGLYDDAREALTELGEGHPLWERLAASSDPGDDQNAPISPDDDRSEEVTPTTTVTVALPDGTRATATIADGELADVIAPTGWTVTELDDDEATLESDDYSVDIEVLSDGSLSLDVTERADEPASSDDSGSEMTSTTGALDDDDESVDSETGTTSTTDATDEERADDSGSDDPETDPSDDDLEDDDTSTSP